MIYKNYFVQKKKYDDFFFNLSFLISSKRFRYLSFAIYICQMKNCIKLNAIVFDTSS